MTSFRALTAFFAGYLHEDWALDGDTPAGLIPQFLSDAGLETGFQLVGEIDVVLARETDEDELKSLVLELGSKYDPTLTGESVRGWLSDLARVAIAELSRRS